MLHKVKRSTSLTSLLIVEYASRSNKTPLRAKTPLKMAKPGKLRPRKLSHLINNIATKRFRFFFEYKHAAKLLSLNNPQQSCYTILCVKNENHNRRLNHHIRYVKDNKNFPNKYRKY